jgi:hypothetical protein
MQGFQCNDCETERTGEFALTLMQRGMRSIGFSALFTLLLGAVAFSVTGCGRTKPTAPETVARYSQELRIAVSANVPAEERKSQMLLIVDQVEALHLRFSQETADFVQSYRKLNADHDAPRAAFDQLFADYNAKRVTARSEALDLHFKLASLATADEWSAIGKAEGKLYAEATEARTAKESKQ